MCDAHLEEVGLALAGGKGIGQRSHGWHGLHQLRVVGVRLIRSTTNAHHIVELEQLSVPLNGNRVAAAGVDNSIALCSWDALICEEQFITLD